jgi:PAS domain S-box-containing protein
MKNDAEMLKALFMNATEGIIVSERKGIIVMANPNAERQFGYGSGELEGIAIEELVPRNLAKQHVQHRENYISNPHPRSMGLGLDLYALRKDGSVFPVEISLSYFKTAEREYVMSFVIDITQRKEQDEYIRKMNKQLEKRVSDRTKALAQANKELALSQAELTGALAKEKELNELKSRFVTTASHEFRTPLAAILSSVSLIDRYVKEEDIEKRQKHINRIKSMVNNLTDILNDFLSIGKLEEGIVRNSPEPLELVSFLGEAMDEIKGILKDGQQVIFSNNKETIHMQMDGLLLKNVVINLISNAIKYSPENKEIHFSVQQLPNALEIEVKDNGIGIPTADLEHVFERFYRARNSTNIQGTGLGLNITKRYVELMGGEIKLESALECGTSIKLLFPLYDESQPTP